MRYLEMTLNEGAGDRRFRAYIPDVPKHANFKANRPAVIIYPGGGYRFTYNGEAEPIAMPFVAAGIPAFVPDYTTKDNFDGKAVFPYCHKEAFSAIRHVRAHAEDYGIDPHNIATLGFSAGGHLAASTATLWNKPIMGPYLDMTDVNRPDKTILCYPVVARHSCLSRLLGDDYCQEHPEALKPFDLDEQIDSQTPPTFIWASAEDKTVPIGDTLLYARELHRHGVPMEMHIYPHGAHGNCLGNCVTGERDYENAETCSEWMGKAIAFMYDAKI